MSSMDSDEVNSISDNAESLQVANIVKTCYFNIITRTHLPEHKQFLQFEDSLSTNTPTLMYLSNGSTRIDWVKYFNSNTLPGNSGQSGFQHDLNLDISSTGQTSNPPPPGYQDVCILSVPEFVNIVTAYNPEDPNVVTYTFSDNSNSFPGNFTLYARSDLQPRYCTVVSDYYVLFDSYDSAVDDTLQASKCMAYGQIIPTWQMVDTFVPLIDEAQVPLLLNEAKSLAFYELKQMLHQKAEQENKRQWSSVQRDKSRSDKPSYFDQLPNFGKWGRSSYSGLSYFKLRGWDYSY